MMEKGATKFDKLCHRLFSANGNGTDYLSRRTGVKCGYCGYELEAYYCESRLYIVECHHCKTCKAISGYQTAEQAGKHVYRVKCSGCGQITPWHSCKHDAQLDWNSRFGEGFR